MNIAIYTLTSELHDEKAVGTMTREFLNSLGVDFQLKGANFGDYGIHSLDLIYVRTGGTEGIFKHLLPELREKSDRPFYLLTSGKNNSLAASAEILSYLRQQHLEGEIIHGSPTYITNRIQLLEGVGQVRQLLKGRRLGVIGEPSDWLISSKADYEQVHRKLGIKLVDIPMQELLDILKDTPQVKPNEKTDNAGIRQALPDANRIYLALKRLIAKHQLHGFTIRCFDLLTAIHNTGCLALAKLNAEKFVAGCEGDIPALLTMAIVRAMSGVSGFQANPASINPETGDILFAHCTIPLNMVERYELDTHFESGIGVGIRGYMKPGPVTIFKVSGDLQHHFIAEGKLVKNQSDPDLCRTQQWIRLADKSQAAYFLTAPIGNHHIILPGHHGELLREILK